MSIHPSPPDPIYTAHATPHGAYKSNAITREGCIDADVTISPRGEPAGAAAGAVALDAYALRITAIQHRHRRWDARSVVLAAVARMALAKAGAA